ncbi:bifunctional phosphoribosylaminoimidazolecarboxamide formyltransferase/IMP cyclohydrolase, partial [bacterium]|nr:bifunctional phosphoribosylaminoimidazolecarboxamide formyltransferase/IMP cyclohydrolase [bacterium]
MGARADAGLLRQADPAQAPGRRRLGSQRRAAEPAGRAARAPRGALRRDPPSPLRGGGGPVKIQRALLSVTDKHGLVELAGALAARGVELIASGGTRRALAAAGIATRELAEYTGSPECLEGRLKTLHPKVFGGILADPARHAADLAALDLPLVDLVVVNLYRFRETAASAADPDIGGPSLLRAAAKNFARVAVLCAPAQYAEFLAALAAGEGAIDLPLRRRLAAAAFAHTRDYDTEIAAWFGGGEPADAPGLDAPLAQLRYGENPHQRGALHAWLASAPPFTQLAGGELSYNNLLDLGAALDLIADLGGGEAAAAVIKHGNPCGIGFGATAAAALDAAWRSDPVSAYGSVVALSAPADAAVACFLAKKFVELLVAPSYSADAREALAAKSKLRLLALPEPAAWRAPRRLRSIGPLLLVQDEDAEFVPTAEWRRVAGPAPDAETLRGLERAWRAVKHVKSNAIVIWREEHLIGAGAGQMSRL